MKNLKAELEKKRDEMAKEWTRAESYYEGLSAKGHFKGGFNAATEILLPKIEKLITQTRNALPEIIQALKQGEKMREALEFYADKKSWGDGNDFYECLVQIHSSDFEDTPDDPNFIYGEYNPPIGGKKARQTLKEVFGE